MSTRINFLLDVDTDDRVAALERRNEVTSLLEHHLGIRVSATDDGTYVYLVDRGMPTLSDRITNIPKRPVQGVDPEHPGAVS